MHNRASHTFLDNKVSKQLFLPEWMHAISTLPIISQTTFLLLSTHSHYRCLASCISISPWLSLLSRGPLRQKKIRWRLAPWCGCLSWPLTPEMTVGVALDEAGTWKVNGAVSHALCLQGQHFKQDQSQTSRWSQTLTGLTAGEPQEPLPPPKTCSIRIRSHGCLS